LSGSEFILRERGIVAIRENHPFVGRVTIYYTPPEGFIARAIEMPERAFWEEVNRAAARKVERAEKRKSVEQSVSGVPIAQPSAAPLKQIRPPTAARA